MKIFSLIFLAEQSEKIYEDQKKELLPEVLELRADRVKQHQFPTYVPPNVKDDMAPDALGSVPFQPTEVIVKRNVPYFALKVDNILLYLKIMRTLYFLVVSVCSEIHFNISTMYTTIFTRLQ